MRRIRILLKRRIRCIHKFLERHQKPIKRIQKLFKRREFYFVITVYPAVFFFLRQIKKIGLEWVAENYNFYAFTSMMAFLFILILVISEVGMKLYNYGLQGDKLKIREKEGVSIGDINNGKRKKQN